MFLHYLSARQQSVLLHYAREIVRADGTIQDDEQAHMDALMLQTAPGVEAEKLPLDDIAGLFSNRRSGVALMMELIGMGCADESLAAEEAAIVEQLASALGFSDEDVLDFKSWVRRQMMLVAEAERLMEG